LTAWLVAAVLVGCVPKGALPVVPAAPEVPAEAVDPMAILAEGAASLDPSARAHALAWLVRTDPDPGAPSWAQRGLWDPEPWVQRQVVDALADRGDAAATLADFVRRDVDPYVRATAGLGLVGDPDAVGAFRAAYTSEPQTWRKVPLALVLARAGDAEAAAFLSKALARGEVGLELEFFDDLGASGLVDLVAALRSGAEHVEPELLLPYAAARLRLGDSDAAEDLRRALAATDSEERLFALDVVTGLPPDLALPLLRRAPAGTDVAGWYAALALVGAGEGDSTRLVQGAAHADREVRLQAARFAGDVGADRSRRDQRAARDTIRIAFADDDAEVRRAAIASVTRLGLDGEGAWLNALLHDDDLAVRVDAAGAVRALVPPP